MENQRIRISKKMLKSALLQLLEKKSLDKITIYELCDTAQINRTTFYKYYGSQAELLADLENDLFSALELHLSALRDLSQLEAVCAQALEHLKANQNDWRVLINTIPVETFATRLFGIFTARKMLGDSVPAHCPPAVAAYYPLFFSYGTYAVIRKWLNDSCQVSIKDVALFITSLKISTDLQ